jgi:hypothetical protein
MYCVMCVCTHVFFHVFVARVCTCMFVCACMYVGMFVCGVYICVCLLYVCIGVCGCVVVCTCVMLVCVFVCFVCTYVTVCVLVCSCSCTHVTCWFVCLCGMCICVTLIHVLGLDVWVYACVLCVSACLRVHMCVGTCVCVCSCVCVVCITLSAHSNWILSWGNWGKGMACCRSHAALFCAPLPAWIFALLAPRGQHGLSELGMRLPG